MRSGRARGLDGALGVGDRLRERLLDEAVLAGLEHAHGEIGVCRDRGGDDDRVELVVGEQVVEVGREARAAVHGGQALAHLGAAVAAPRELGAVEAVEVAGEVRAPVAEPDDADPDGGVAGRSGLARIGRRNAH